MKDKHDGEPAIDEAIEEKTKGEKKEKLEEVSEEEARFDDFSEEDSEE